ncbi:MAG: sigma-E processing peptidase SpoIIGA [Eubacterium sp.]
MIQNIYIDVYFGLNFLMDFVVLLITRIVIKSNRSIFRVTMSAGFGALYAVMILVFQISAIASLLCTYIVVAELMTLLAFGRANLRNSIKNILILYFVTFVTSGIINAFYYGTGFKKNIVELANADTFGNISISFILCISVIMVTTAMAVAERIRAGIKRSDNIFQVQITAGSKKVSVVALRDTGNSLIEPMTKKPVSVIEEDSLKPLDMESLRYLVIPYNSVGKSHGLMKGFIADRLEINGKIIENAVIGIHEGRLSQDKKYEMILHPSIIENKEN